LRIDVTGAEPRESAAVRAMVIRRVHFALSRFGVRVQRVTVRIAKPTNPLGGIDHRCRMRARLQVAGDVRAEAINGKVDAAVDRAATRLATGVGWALECSPGTRGRALRSAPCDVTGPPTRRPSGALRHRRGPRPRRPRP
jgi:putative sigma-54 modulation protein